MSTIPQYSTSTIEPRVSTGKWLQSEQTILLVQGGFYLVTGFWPLFDIDSFQAVTGPKTDLWLVRTVGTILAVIGVVLLIAARKPRASTETKVLAIGIALALTLVDVVFVFSKVISPVYLLDGAAELGLIAWWIWTLKPTTEVIHLPESDSPGVAP